MLQLSKKVTIAPLCFSPKPLSKEPGITSSNPIFLGEENFIGVARLWFEKYFENSNGFSKFIKFYLSDVHVKTNRYDFLDHQYYGMRSLSLGGYKTQSQNTNINLAREIFSKFCKDSESASSLEGFGFEILLCNALAKNLPRYWDPLLKIVEELSWKKLIEDWLVLKNQVLNAFSNDLSWLLPEFRYFPENPLARVKAMKSSPYFSWIFDPEFTPSNWRTIKDQHDPLIYAKLYCSWIRYRQKNELNNKNTEFYRLSKIIELIKNGEWKTLLLNDLKENWVSVYIETDDYKRYNTALVGSIYNSYANKNLDYLNFLFLKERF